jgi:hypothetical protein
MPSYEYVLYILYTRTRSVLHVRVNSIVRLFCCSIYAKLHQAGSILLHSQNSQKKQKFCRRAVAGSSTVTGGN